MILAPRHQMQSTSRSRWSRWCYVQTLASPGNNKTAVFKQQFKTTRWLNQPMWKKWSSNWIISLGRGENKKCLKPAPRKHVWQWRKTLQNSFLESLLTVKRLSLSARWLIKTKLIPKLSMPKLYVGNVNNIFPTSFFYGVSWDNVTWKPQNPLLNHFPKVFAAERLRIQKHGIGWFLSGTFNPKCSIWNGNIYQAISSLFMS